MSLNVPLLPGSRYLTLISTDAGNGISHDQIFFADARIEGDQEALSEADQLELHTTRQALHDLESARDSLKPVPTFYGPV